MKILNSKHSIFFKQIKNLSQPNSYLQTLENLFHLLLLNDFNLFIDVGLCPEKWPREKKRRKKAPKKIAPGKLPPGNIPPRKFHLRKNAPQKNAPEENCTPEKYPPKNCFTRFLLMLTLSYSCSFLNFLQ